MRFKTFVTAAFITSMAGGSVLAGDATGANMDRFNDLRGMVRKAAMTCFKSGERTSGLNKICYYNCAGSTAAITIKSHQLCPLSIKN